MTRDVRPAPVQHVDDDQAGRRGLEVLLPIVGLGLVVASAWLGAVVPEPPARDPALLRPTVPVIDPSAGRSGLEGLVPARALGLDVQLGSELQAAHAAGRIGGELVAVAGILRSEPLPLGCPAMHMTLSHDFCHRLAAIFAAEEGPAGSPSASGDRRRTSASQLAGHILPGTGVPSSLARESTIGPRQFRAVPVVLVGRYGDPRAPACAAGEASCRDDFVIEQFVWAGGAWLSPPIVWDTELAQIPPPMDGTQLGAVTRRSTSRQEVILAATAVRPELLALVDPTAAGSVADARAGRLWYVRSMVGLGAGRAQVAWAVMDDSGLVLGYSWPGP